MKIEVKKIIPVKPDTRITGSFGFVIKATDEPEAMTWHDAIAKFDINPDSEWRLPSRHELFIMYENKEEIDGFDTDYYWSSSEYTSSNAWVQGFSSGNQYFFNHKDKYRLVRLVKKGIE